MSAARLPPPVPSAPDANIRSWPESRNRTRSTDRCPGAIVLHEAEDGWLARVRVPGGRLTSLALRSLLDAAGMGNGLVEITSRANVQVRGLPAACGEELSRLLARSGMLPSLPHDRVRNLLASPLAGRHPGARAPTDPVVAALDEALCARPEFVRLPGRFLFAVDDGSGLAPGPPADVTLLAVSPADFVLLLAGRRAGDAVAPGIALERAIGAARAFLGIADGAWRIAELPDGAKRIAAALELRLHPDAGERREPLRPGRAPQRDGRIALTAVAPLGRLDVTMLEGLARLAPEVRVSSERTVTVLDLDPEAAVALAPRLEDLGLLLTGAGGWTGLSACAGLGRCPRALVDVRGAATRRAAVRGPAAPAEHWSACERQCGRSAEQPVAVTATPAGLRIDAGGQVRRARSVEDALGMLAAGSA